LSSYAHGKAWKSGSKTMGLREENIWEKVEADWACIWNSNPYQCRNSRFILVASWVPLQEILRKNPKEENKKYIGATVQHRGTITLL
jgi:hypothetical protein